MNMDYVTYVYESPSSMDQTSAFNGVSLLRSQEPYSQCPEQQVGDRLNGGYYICGLKDRLNSNAHIYVHETT